MIELSPTAADAMLDVLGRMMDGGSIELMADNGRLIAELNLSSPATLAAVDGELEFNPIAIEDAAIAAGNITSARILGVLGDEVFSCDVGDESSEAVIKLHTTKIYRGAPIRLESFRLTIP